MAARRTYNVEARRRIANALDQLPEKPKSQRPLSAEELLVDLRPKIQAALTKGYSVEEIASHIDKAGTPVSLYALRRMIRTIKPRQRKSSGSSNATSDNSQDSEAMEAGSA